MWMWTDYFSRKTAGNNVALGVFGYVRTTPARARLGLSHGAAEVSGGRERGGGGAGGVGVGAVGWWCR